MPWRHDVYFQNDIIQGMTTDCQPASAGDLAKLLFRQILYIYIYIYIYIYVCWILTKMWYQSAAHFMYTIFTIANMIAQINDVYHSSRHVYVHFIQYAFTKRTEGIAKRVCDETKIWNTSYHIKQINFPMGTTETKLGFLVFMILFPIKLLCLKFYYYENYPSCTPLPVQHMCVRLYKASIWDYYTRNPSGPFFNKDKPSSQCGNKHHTSSKIWNYLSTP